MFGRRRRRRARRERAGWLGRYAPVESPGRDWSRCRVLDVSIGGARLDLLGADARIGDRFLLDVQLVRSTVACVTLTGEVRDVARPPHGHGTDGVHVGVRFVEVGELELALLQRLVARQKHERRHAGVVIPLTTSRAWD